MDTSTYRRTTIAGLAAVALAVAGCSNGTSIGVSAQEPQVALVVTSEVPAPPA